MLNLHIVELDESRRILYFPKSMRFFTVSNSQAEQFKLIANSLENTTETQLSVDVNDTGYKYAVQLLEEKLNIEIGEFDVAILPRLVLNISNDCNLRCRYCYASGGSYSGTRGMMQINTLQQTMDAFYSYFKGIESIQLFGGEPAMNIPAIEHVCNYIKEHGYSTQIGIVTNGTIMPPKLIELIRSHNIFVTVSIDVELLHDKMRPFTSGKGSWKIICENIRRLKEYGQPGKLEVTYTRQHIDNDISIFDTVVELRSFFGIDNIHIAPVSCSDEQYHINDIGCFSRSVDDFMSRPDLDITPYSLLLTMLKSLKAKNSNQYICFAGFGTIAVSANGEVYPCFYFCENKDFVQCSVFDEHERFAESIRNMQNRYLSYDRGSREECQRCFAYTICRGCLGDNYYETGSEYKTSQEVCDMTRGMLERLLVNLSIMNSSKENL